MKAKAAIERPDRRGASPEEILGGEAERLRQERVLRLVDGLRLPAGARALHLGCGQLALCGELLGRGLSLLGMDASATAVRIARQFHAQEYPLAEFRVGGAEALDLADESFDLIVADMVIGQLAHDRWAFQEMRRVLRPGGHLVLSAANRPAPRALLRSLLSSGSSVEYARAGERGGEREYWGPLLVRGLAELGYETPRAETCNFKHFSGGLQRLADSSIPGLFDWLGASCVILCRRRVVPADVEDRWIFTAAADRIGRFELTRKRDILRRARLYGERSDLPEARPVPLERLTGTPERALVLAALPGDELLGCGGTLLALRERGTRIALVGPAREESGEIEAVAVALGAARHSVAIDPTGIETKATGAGPDGAAGNAAAELAALIDRLRPQLIFAPARHDRRPERARAADLLQAALSLLSQGLAGTWVAEYEAESLAPANTFTEIDSHMSRKLRLLLEYRGAMRERDLARHCRVANSYHAHKLQGRKGFCENFHTLSAREYLAFHGERTNR